MAEVSRHPKTRAYCRERSTRSISAEVWETHRETILRLFYQRDPELCLKEIRERMTVEHNFEASTKQWKIQLSKWELKRNMNLSDAAQILSLIRDAETRNINRRISFFDSEKTREDIRNYLKKTNRVKSEDELLQHVKHPHVRPSYITFEDLSYSPREGIRQQQALQTPSTVDFSSEYVVVSPPSDPSPSLQDMKTSAGNWDMQLSNFPGHHNFSSPPSFDPPPQHLETGETADYLIDPWANIGHLDSNGFLFSVGDMALLNKLMSVTPVVCPPKRLCTPGESQPIFATEVTQMLGCVQESEELDHGIRTQQFLRKCCEACIYFGQGCAGEGEQSIDCANQIYGHILIHEPMESLTVLNNLRVLFDAYGQRMLTDRIFALALKTAETREGVDNPITQSIQFVSSIPEQGSGGPPPYDISMLKNIHKQFADTVGKLSKLSLTAQFHVAWALAELKRFDEAKDILMHLQLPCETVFGPCHIQTIACVATLARVYHATGQGISAERLLRETVITRVEERFSRSHPYLWEARNRQALFLIKLAKGESDTRRRQLENKAEGILREILDLRNRGLGPSNPRTAITFRALRRLLLRQNRTNEADTLHQWSPAEDSFGTIAVFVIVAGTLPLVLDIARAIATFPTRVSNYQSGYAVHHE
ncbi:hypothetical protein DV736_g44, partial [Chaetothyriales sp. CBS 134916]